MWSYWVQKIGVWLTIVFALILSPVIMTQVIDGDIFTLSLYIVALGGIIFITQSVQRQWIYIVCSLSAFGVNLNFLPANFTIFEIAVLMVGTHFVLEHVMIRHKGLRYGNFWVLCCLTVIAGIIFYHWFRQGIGFKMLGGGEVGARKNFMAILGIVAYFLVVTLGKGQWTLLNRVPWWAFVTSLAVTVPFVLSTLFPVTVPYIYRFISSVNVEAYREGLAMTNQEDSLGRIGQLGAVANTLLLFLLAQYPVKNWWRPERWWVAVLFLIAFALCLRGGFRNAVFWFIMAFGVGLYLSLRLKSLWVALAGIAVLWGLAAGHGTFFKLPPSVQRTLSFMPGEWDAIVISTTESSNDFRQQIQDIYIREYLHKSPWIGNGFNYRLTDLYALNFQEGVWAYGMTPYDFHKGFIIRKDFHIGWISLYDTVGIIGGVFFILLFCVNMYFLVKSYNYFYKKDALPPILVWVFVQAVAYFVSFFKVAGAFSHMLPVMCILCALTYLIYERVKEERQAAITENISTTNNSAT